MFVSIIIFLSQKLPKGLQTSFSQIMVGFSGISNQAAPDLSPANVRITIGTTTNAKKRSFSDFRFQVSICLNSHFSLHSHETKNHLLKPFTSICIQIFFTEKFIT